MFLFFQTYKIRLLAQETHKQFIPKHINITREKGDGKRRTSAVMKNHCTSVWMGFRGVGCCRWRLDNRARQPLHMWIENLRCLRGTAGAREVKNRRSWSWPDSIHRINGQGMQLLDNLKVWWAVMSSQVSPLYTILKLLVYQPKSHTSIDTSLLNGLSFKTFQLPHSL